MKDAVLILGARGSVPVHLSTCLRYGGTTTCVLVRLAGQSVVLDAGTGILALNDVLPEGERDLPLLVSHPHVDHLLGLPMCAPVFDPQQRFRVYAAPHGGLDARAQLCALLSPPLWPVGPEQLPARIDFHTIDGSFTLGPVQVDVMEGVHPGGVTLFRLSASGKRVVFVTDCTLTDDLLPSLTEFARDCDLLLCDGQYSDKEWPARSVFGHSTWTAAARLGAACGAKRVRIIHHDPDRTDDMLDQFTPQLLSIHKNCAFARAGEEIPL